MLDVAIIGGSFAGLSAALQLGRASRSVAIIDDGKPRNRVSAAAHGVPGWDGVPPGEILQKFRADLVPYPTVGVHTGQVTDVTGRADAFTLGLNTGETLKARRIILAHGVRDVLPDIPGLTERWGNTVLHCPYCHGYEVRHRPLAVLATGAMAAHQAVMLRTDWSDDVTVLTQGIADLDTAALQAAGIKIDARQPQEIEGAESARVRFNDGSTTDYAAIFTAPGVDISGSPAAILNAGLADGPTGKFVRVGPMQQTDVPGVFAAGDLATPMWNVNFAVGDGARAGAGCHQSLLFPDFVPPLERDVA